MKRINLLTGALLALMGLVTLLAGQWMMAATWLVLGAALALSDLSYAPAGLAVAPPALPPARRLVSIALTVLALLLFGWQIARDVRARAHTMTTPATHLRRA